ncbi:hypothetical protein JW960_20085 [candidate division KSB1 bacterium]|nr:hypothetical protein [candidate division KSB1 bacterium]
MDGCKLTTIALLVVFVACTDTFRQKDAIIFTSDADTENVSVHDLTDATTESINQQRVETSNEIFNDDLYQLTPPGSDQLVLSDFTPIISLQTNTIESISAIYEIDEQQEKIYCSQKIGIERVNLEIHFPEMEILSGITFRQDRSTAGYRIFGNNNIEIAFHSDGTMWVEVKQPGTAIDFISRLQGGDRDYDKGGGKFEPGVTYPSRSATVVQTNWLVITDKGAPAEDHVSTTGGFGVYVRPYKSQSWNKNYYPRMERDAQTDDIVHLITSDSKYYDGCRFIVSLFPAKKRDMSLINTRMLYLYPGEIFSLNPVKRVPSKVYAFPRNMDVQAWANPTPDPAVGYLIRKDSEYPADGFYYRSPLKNPGNPSVEVNLAVNTILLFESIWQHSNESKYQPDSLLPKNTSGHAFIPYQPPAASVSSQLVQHGYSPSDELNHFLKRMSTTDSTTGFDFSTIRILVYVSGLDQYNQLPRPVMPDRIFSGGIAMTGDEYYDAFMGEMKRLFTQYPRINGLYIDTLPLNGVRNDPLKLEPMILSYRIMRDLKRLYPDKLIYLHSSENPIGNERIWGGINRNLGKQSDNTNPYRWDAAGLVQSEIYAPFIDRYADIIKRGEGYPIDIALNDQQRIADYLSPYIKFVANPVGKSNCIGTLKWTDTRWFESGKPYPFYLASQKPITAFHDNAYRISYYQDDFPVSIDNSAGSSRDRYQVFEISEVTPESHIRNCLLVMNAMLDNYIDKGYLIMYSASAERDYPAPNFDVNSYDRRMQYCYPGPDQGGIYDVSHFPQPFGVAGRPDYYRPVPIAWHSSYNIARGLPPLSK